MTEVVPTGGGGDSMSSSPDQQLPWPMVPVLQTLTVLSDGEEEQMEQKMGIENGFGLSVTKVDHSTGCNPMQQIQHINNHLHNHPNNNHNQNHNNQNNNNYKRKVGRPITSVKTMNRSFPAVDEIRAKLDAGECYVRPRASSSSSDVWELFQEVAYKENHLFTGIVQCKTCKFLTRYHGQITGTSHMRRHHCFSLLFPNSTPANRKPKTNPVTGAGAIQSSKNNNIGRSSTINAINFNMADADSTTPRMLKKLKKEISAQQKFKSEFQSNATTTIHMAEASSNANITIHPAIPKKKFKNGNGVVHHPNERSLISAVVATNGVAGNGSQSMLRTNANHHNNNSNSNNGYNSPSSSAASSPSHHHSSSASSSSPNTLNVPTVNFRIQSSKQDLRERLIQFCSEELVPLKSVTSESFRNVLQSHLRLCTSQMLQQFLPQPQLMNVATTLSHCLNHLPSQIPDHEQLRSYLEIVVKQCLDKIRQDINANLESNVGSALICDSDQDACIISVYYVDNDWRLNEAILSASATVFDINQFVARTLDNYALQDRKKLSKFTFVSHGGLFGGVSVCLSSMAHIVDKVVDESLSTIDDTSNDSTISLSDLFDSCHELAIRLNIPVEFNNTYDVDWIAKYELMQTLLSQQEMINLHHPPSDDGQESAIDFNLVSMIVKLLEPFRTASHELRQCFNHPTLCHVLLYFHKLKKVLANNISHHHHHQQHQNSDQKPTNQNSHKNNNNKTSTSNRNDVGQNVGEKPKNIKLTNNDDSRRRRRNSSNNNNHDNKIKDSIEHHNNIKNESDSDSNEEKDIDDDSNPASTINGNDLLENSMKNNDDDDDGDDEDNEGEAEKEVEANDDDDLEVNNGDGCGQDEEDDDDDDDEDDDDDDDEEEDEDNQSMNNADDINNSINNNDVDSVVDRLKQTLMDNLLKHYQVQSLHRIATFLWPNFRLLKMLTGDEQKEVHEDVRKLIQSRISTSSKTNTNTGDQLANGGGGGNPAHHSDIHHRRLSTNDLSMNGVVDQNHNSKSRSDFDEWEIFSDQDQDEVDKYLSVQLTSCSEHFVLNWWKEHSQEFPKLSQLAKWILSIPASVTTRERFQIMKNRQVDDMLLFLHCNIQTDKFDLTQMKKMTNNNGKTSSNKSKHNNNNSNKNPINISSNNINYASSLIAN